MLKALLRTSAARPAKMAVVPGSGVFFSCTERCPVRRQAKELRHATHRSAAGPRLQSAGPGAYRRVLARRELLVRRADLPAGQPAAARAPAGRARQAPPARALGDDARTEPPVRAHE